VGDDITGFFNGSNQHGRIDVSASSGTMSEKVAWVTGAGSGIGQAAAIELARAGALVVVSGSLGMSSAKYPLLVNAINLPAPKCRRPVSSQHKAFPPGNLVCGGVRDAGCLIGLREV
jgi:hypothetical protein